MKRQLEYIEGFRLTRKGDSLLIEATDYHAMPLRPDRKELSKLGLRLVAPPKEETDRIGDEEEKEKEL